MRRFTKSVYIFLSVLIYSTSVHAYECGVYEFTGVVRATQKDGYQLIMNEKSYSEIKLAVRKEDLFKFASYLNKFITGKIHLNEKREMSKPEDIRVTVPDPLKTSAESTFHQIKKDECKL